MKLSLAFTSTTLLLLLSLSAAAVATTTLPLNDPETGFVVADDLWHCFHYFGSGEEGTSHPSINFLIETADDAAKWSLTVSKGADFKKGLSYTNMNSYICNDILIENGVCTEESRGFLVKKVFESEDHLVQQYLTKNETSYAYTQIQETDAYCVYLHNMTPEILSAVTVQPDYISGIPGSKVCERRGLILKSVLSLLLIWVYIKKWQGKEMELDLMNKLIIVFFIAVECATPVLGALNITFAGAHWGFLASLVSFVAIALSLTGSAAQVCFITLLTKGYTALSEQEFPLKSSHYRMVFILTGAYIASFIVSFFYSPILQGSLLIVIYFYQIVQYVKTNRLLASLSLRSSTRRAMTLKLVLFYLPIAYLALVIMMVVIFTSMKMDPIILMQSAPDWSPNAEFVGYVVGYMIDPLIFFVILIRYWTPEAIYQDSFGFEPTIDLNKQPDDDIII